MHSPVWAGAMLTLFVTLAIMLTGDDLARKQVVRQFRSAHASDMLLLNQSLHTMEGLDLTSSDTHERAGAVAASKEFSAAVRRAMFNVDAVRVDVFTPDRDHVFSTAGTPAPLVGPVVSAFERALGGATASAYEGPDSLFLSATRSLNAVTTFERITSTPPGAQSAGTTLMVAAITTDITDELATAQRAVWWAAGTFGGGLLLVLWVVYWVSERSRQRLRAANSALQEQNEAVRGSRQRMLTAADMTRRAIAEELHGSVQTKLFALWLRLSELRNRTAGNADPALTEQLDGIITEMDRIREEDIRALSHRLHPGTVRVSASAALRSLCNFYQSLCPVNLKVSLAAAGLEPAGMSQLSEDTRLGIYRIAEMALGNVARHAGASHCEVTFDYDLQASELKLVVRDDGRGFDPAATVKRGLGFVTMDDYASALGGRLVLHSAAGEGATITLSIPFKPAPAETQDRVQEARPAASFSLSPLRDAAGAGE